MLRRSEQVRSIWTLYRLETNLKGPSGLGLGCGELVVRGDGGLTTPSAVELLLLSILTLNVQLQLTDSVLPRRESSSNSLSSSSKSVYAFSVTCEAGLGMSLPRSSDGVLARWNISPLDSRGVIGVMAS